jgi:hypothetical protein
MGTAKMSKNTDKRHPKKQETTIVYTKDTYYTVGEWKNMKLLTTTGWCCFFWIHISLTPVPYPSFDTLVPAQTNRNSQIQRFGADSELEGHQRIIRGG